MILVDSNIFMYAAGDLHPNKRPSIAWLERVARAEIEQEAAREGDRIGVCTDDRLEALHDSPILCGFTLAEPLRREPQCRGIGLLR